MALRLLAWLGFLDVSFLFVLILKTPGPEPPFCPLCFPPPLSVALSLTPAPSDLHPGCGLQAPPSYRSLTCPFHPVDLLQAPPLPGPRGLQLSASVLRSFPLLFICLACLFLDQRC